MAFHRDLRLRTILRIGITEAPDLADRETDFDLLLLVDACEWERVICIKNLRLHLAIAHRREAAFDALRAYWQTPYRRALGVQFEGLCIRFS